ncbi:hypothetical protein [Caldalkalibacillus salinus]|uniref:hypothetical protein n=1 Tax=Caldalkalibacillus salinus TaxID=2803787 RepID=UPI0019237883|nr:hypothetical protein [Caldalkalibacillus salinus]
MSDQTKTNHHPHDPDHPNHPDHPHHPHHPHRPVSFKDVLGSFLLALAEGREISDQMSKYMAQQYLNDETMRGFPVPRPDIEKIDMELKFALHEDPCPNEAALSDRVNRTSVYTSYALTTSMEVGSLHDMLEEINIEAIRAESEKITTELIKDPTYLVGCTPWVSDVDMTTYDLDQVAHDILDTILKRKWAKLRDDSVEDVQLEMKRVLTPTKDRHEEGIIQLRKGLNKDPQPLKLMILHDDLMHVSKDVLSTLKLTFKIKDYEWHQVDMQDGEPAYKLVRE